MRNRPKAADASIGRVLDSMRQDVERRAARVGTAAEAWLDLAPASIIEGSAVEGFRTGTLEIAVEGSAMKFLVDRALREGLEARLRERLPALRKVRVRVDATILPGAGVDEPRAAPDPATSRPPRGGRSGGGPRAIGGSRPGAGSSATSGTGSGARAGARSRDRL